MFSDTPRTIEREKQRLQQFFLPFGNDGYFLSLFLFSLFLFGAKQPPLSSSILLLSGKERTPLRPNFFLISFQIIDSGNKDEDQQRKEGERENAAREGGSAPLGGCLGRESTHPVHYCGKKQAKRGRDGGERRCASVVSNKCQ